MEYLAEENGLVERSYRLLHMMYQFQDTELKTLIVFVSGMPKPALRISTYFSLMMDSMNLLHSFILGLSRSARALCSYKCSVFLIRELNIKFNIVMLVACWTLRIETLYLYLHTCFPCFKRFWVANIIHADLCCSLPWGCYREWKTITTKATIFALQCIASGLQFPYSPLSCLCSL